MSNDDALAIADASTVDLWRQCAADDAAYGVTHTPDGLREQALDTLAETVRAAVTLAADYLGVDDPALRSIACVQAAVEHAERLRADLVRQAERIAELEEALNAALCTDWDWADKARAALAGKEP